MTQLIQYLLMIFSCNSQLQNRHFKNHRPSNKTSSRSFKPNPSSHGAESSAKLNKHLNASKQMASPNATDTSITSCKSTITTSITKSKNTSTTSCECTITASITKSKNTISTTKPTSTISTELLEPTHPATNVLNYFSIFNVQGLKPLKIASSVPFVQDVLNENNIQMLNWP